MKIAFIAYESVNNVNAWSGTIHFMAKYLAKDNELILIDNLSNPSDILYKLLASFNRLLGKSYDYRRNISFVKSVCKRIQKRLDKTDYDLVFAPGSIYITYLKSDKPIVIWADATFKSLTKSYPQYINFTKKRHKIGNNLEQIAFDNCTKLIFTATWAAESTIKDYNIDKSNIEVVPLGANLIHQHSKNDIIGFNSKKSKDEVNLLFVGVDWQKKGGDLLLSIFKELKEISPIYKLDVAGSKPSPTPEIEGVTFHGFLNKADNTQKDKLDSLYQKAHYFLLPTKAEAFGIVFCEANSYGLPTFGSNLGGVPDIIKDGVNGELIDIKKTPKELAHQIHKYISEGDYTEKSLRAFHHYQENFTWDKSIERVNKILQELVYE